MDKITPKDIPALAALHAQCFSAAWNESALSNLLENGGFGYSLSLSSLGLAQGSSAAQEIIAFLLLRSAATETEILTLATHPLYQRQGLAKKLLHHACNALPAQGIEEIFLEVRADNLAAQVLYTACGFTEIARRPNYYALPDGSRQDALVLRKRLSI